MLKHSSNQYDTNVKCNSVAGTLDSINSETLIPHQAILFMCIVKFSFSEKLADENIFMSYEPSRVPDVSAKHLRLKLLRLKHIATPFHS